MRFSTLLVASSTLLGLTCATPEHKLRLRQAPVTNSSTTVPPSTSSSATLSSSTSSSSASLPTIALPNFVLAVQPSGSSKTKRQTSGFVGLNGNALVVVQASANAAVFASVGGQLSSGGLSVFASAASVAAPGFTALSVEAVAAISTDITTTFGAGAGGAVAWANAAFPSGNAVFFVLNGAVYASFTGGALPAGAVVVSLVPVTPSAANVAVSVNVSFSVSVTVTVNVAVNIGIGGVLVKNTQTVTQTIYQACNTITGSNGALTTITYVVPPTAAVTTIPVVTKTITSLGAGVTTVVSGGSTVVVVASAAVVPAATTVAVAGGSGSTATAAVVKPVFTGAAVKNAAGSLAVIGAGLAFFL